MTYVLKYIHHFLPCRSRLNLFLRQPSGLSLADEEADSEHSGLDSPTHTCSNDVNVERSTSVGMASSREEGAGLEGVGSSEDSKDRAQPQNDTEEAESGENAEHADVRVTVGQVADLRAESEGGTVGHVMLSRLESVSEEVRRSPGFRFLTRPDLYKLAKV